MASTGSCSKKRSLTPRWRGVVEDFVDLKLEENSYECILKHTDNLLRKTRRHRHNVAELLKEGLLPALVRIVRFHDRRDSATLQHTAVNILQVILGADPKPEYCSILKEAGVLPPLLNLLQLYLDDFSLDILHVISLLKKPLGAESFATEPGCIDILFQVARSQQSAVQKLALDHLADVLAVSSCWKSLEGNIMLRNFQEILVLLGDSKVTILTQLCKIYENMATNASKEVIETIEFHEMCSAFRNVLNEGRTNKALADCVSHVVSCIRSFACSLPNIGKLFSEHGILDCLLPYRNDPEDNFHVFYNLSWALTYMIIRGEKEVMNTMIEKALLPSLREVFHSDCAYQQTTTKQLLERLTQHNTFLTYHLDTFLLDYLVHLNTQEEYTLLEKLLQVFQSVLQEETLQSKGVTIRAAMTLEGRLRKLCSLNHCPRTSIKSLVANIHAVLNPTVTVLGPLGRAGSH